ncbi:WcaF family extracellular polysaccharide biosynthesis acetyltransferase [Paenibacillus abyssi]|uniref:Colanic acid biosynthesis acetyltransferase WcaF n=1 Tax=Paenibacillus abyssi TaxID=1340531 RepID=A0A917G3Y5_9BACL|nr:WcaF family extracellular polysaccharide biosynthesis acetyltransferase [Paenibacillus abyssi]GGG21665.1 colanic acid biosynthesis acetyltransferase WcaF [Paenibacillus abyssi]
MVNKVRLDLYQQTEYSRGRSGIVILLWWFIQGTLFRFSLHNMYRWRSWLLKKFGAQIGRGVLIRATAKFTYPWKVKIGDHSWIGDNVQFYSLDEIIIGNHCVISQNTYLCTGSHKIDDPSFALSINPIVIKDGAWIASDVFVYPGVTVNEMGVAGARSTVTKDIPYNEIHVGYPAKFLKKRFVEEVMV